MLSRSDVVELYRCILGRTPESEETISNAMRDYADFESFRRMLLLSVEFQVSLVPPVRYLFDATDTKLPNFWERDIPSICLVAIVKNEEHCIETMIKSVSPIIKHYAVLDTGSNDGTRRLIDFTLGALQKESTIREAEFVNFSQARNLSLSLVPDCCEWILILDADEHIVQSDLARLCQLTQCSLDIDGWHLPRFNFVDRHKSLPPKNYPDFQKRLFRNITANPIQYAGLVHEQPTSEGQWQFSSAHNFQPNGWIGGPHIHHMGFVDVDFERWLEKHSLYERLTNEITTR